MKLLTTKFFHFDILNQFEDKFSEQETDKLVKLSFRGNILFLILDLLFMATFAVFTTLCCLKIVNDDVILHYGLFIFSSLVIISAFRFNASNRNIIERKIGITLLLMSNNSFQTEINEILLNKDNLNPNHLRTKIETSISRHFHKDDIDLSSLDIEELQGYYAFPVFKSRYFTYLPSYLWLQITFWHLIVFPFAYLTVLTLYPIYPVLGFYGFAIINAYLVFTLIDYPNFIEYAAFRDTTKSVYRDAYHYLFDLKNPSNRKNSAIAIYILYNSIHHNLSKI